MSFLERLKKGSDNKRSLPYPGTKETVVIHVLSEGERQDAQFAAEHHFKKNDIEVSMSTVDAYEAEKTLQMLYRAVHDADDKPLAHSVDEFRGLIDVEEKNALVDEYLAFEKECSPNPNLMSVQEIDALIEDLKKKPETVGSVSSMHIAQQLITSLVSRLQSLQAGNGSTS
jgi:hypothetical protein